MPLYQFYPISNTENDPAHPDRDFGTIDDPKGQADDSATRIKIRQNVTGVRYGFGKTVRAMTSINTVTFVIRQRAANPVELTPPELAAGIMTSDFVSEYVVHSKRPPRDKVWRTFEYLLTSDPITSAPWEPVSFADYEFFLRAEDPATSDVNITQMYLDVDGVAAEAGEEDDGERIGLERGSTSGIIQVFGKPLPVVELDLPIRYFDVPLLRWLQLSHYSGPSPDAVGWDPESDQAWRRGRIFVLAKEIVPGQLPVKIRGLLDRNIVRRLWDVLVSEESPKPDLSAGMARFHPAGRKFMRDTAAWVENAEARAQGSMNILSLLPDQDKHAGGGTWFERLRTQWLQFSSNHSGGLDETGTGVNGSAIEAEISELLFDVDVTTEGIRFTAGDPVADVYRTWPETEELHANSIVALLFYHISDSPLGVPMGALSWSLQRGVDDFYYDASGPTWGASLVWNDLTITEENLRESVRNIDVGADPTTLILSVGISSTGENSQENILHHVQLVEGRNPGTPIVAPAAEQVNCAADSLRFASLHAREQAWNPEHGHVFRQVVPDWSSEDLAAGDERVVAEILYENRTPWIETVAGTEGNEFSVRWVDDDDYHRLSYVNGTGWRFRHRRQGVNTDAVIAGSVVAGQVYNVAGVWTGPEGEQDREPYTQSVIVDGVRGTDAVAAGSHAPIPSRALVTVGASQLWRPDDFDACVLWVEGDRGVYKNGSLQTLGAGHGLYADEEIALWEDQSGNGNDLVGTGAPRIQLEDLNGLDTLSFDQAENAYYVIPDLGLTESHWFYLVWFDNVADNRILLGSATGALQGTLRTTSGKLQVLGPAAAWLDLIDPLEAEQWLILEVVQYAGSIQGMKNGVHGGLRVTATADYSGQDLELGADNEANTKTMTVYSVLVFDRVLRMDESRLPLTYLASKAGLAPLQCAHRAVFKHCDGQARHFRVGEVVPHDEEMADLP